jgi:hypothetical protein
VMQSRGREVEKARERELGISCFGHIGAGQAGGCELTPDKRCVVNPRC